MSLLQNRRLAVASALFILFACSGLVRAEESLWTTDFKAAQAKAKKENKFLLVNFTGSDWCGWCKKLEAEVFGKEVFIKEAPKNFVLVVLDYPQENKQSDDLKKQNETLREKYKIQGFPSILLLDAAGEVVAKTGYQPDGPEKYLASLDDFLKTYKEIVAIKAKLDSLKGLDRAKALDQLVEGYEKLGTDAPQIADWCKEIIQLDAKNEAGLKTKYEIRLLIEEASQYAENEQFDKAKETFDKLLAIKELTPEQKQEAYLGKAQCELPSKNFVGVAENIKKAIEVDPKSKRSEQLAITLKMFEKKAEAQITLAKIAAELKDAKGADRAKVLDRFIDAKRSFYEDVQGVPAANPGGLLGHQYDMGGVFSETEVQDMAKQCKEIISLDADGKAGLKRKYEFRSFIADAEIAFREKDFDGVQSLLDKALALPNLTDAEKQGAFFLKADAFLMLKDLQQALDFTKKSREASKDADSPFAKMLDQRIERLEAIKDMIEKQKEAAKADAEKEKKGADSPAAKPSNEKKDAKPAAEKK